MSALPLEVAARIERQQALHDTLSAGRPGAVPPYFGHMRLRTGAGGETDLLLGSVNELGHRLSIIDWRAAPLAEVFFAHGEGEDYEVDVAGRQVTGTLVEKNLVSFSGNRLTALECEHGAAAWTRDGWQVAEPGTRARIEPRAKAARKPFRSPLEVTLDPAQQAIVDLPDDQSVLILGEAGFGKTTVALHRLVALKERSQKRKFLAAVVVPTEGLRRLTEHMLERRGVQGVEVWTYERWASKMARKIFKDLPKRESEGASAQVVRLKRHRALRPVLEAFVKARRHPSIDKDRPSRSKALARRADLEHLFGDSAWMGRVVQGADGAFGPGAVGDVTEHTRIQFLDPTEKEYAHVDRDALVTSDARRIDEGTPMEDAESMDPEDYAVLFELERLRAQAHGVKPAPIPHYDCIVVDEAQEFAPLELSLLSRSVARHGTVIVAGDAQQQVDATADFAGWEQVMADLGALSHERATLEVNYRCPPDVTELARTLIDQRGPPLKVQAPSVFRALQPSALHLSAWLIEELRALTAADPSSSIAVVARSSAQARALYASLNHALTVRLSLEGEFEFRAGALVTSVLEVKGLEFDYVIVPDADAASYPELPEARRALYVAVTRATHRLGLGAAARWSPLLSTASRPDRKQLSLGL